MKRLSIIVLTFAAAGILVAATLPASSPTHSGMSQGQILGHIADNTQRVATGSGVATLPVAAPAHSGMSQGQLLGYIADNTQDIAANTARIYRPETYGAIAGDAGDDLAAIQAAINAASAAGGGTVQLSAGRYIVTTINSPASGDKAAGAYAIEPQSNTTLAGAGQGVTTIRGVAGGSFGVGVIISPFGMRDATANFGAASNVRLRDFTIEAPEQADSSGNLVNLVHAQDWLIERVTFGSSLHHGLEVDQSRRITVKDCVWNGSYTGVSGSWVQFDLGAAGPVNRPGTITTTLIQDVLFENCRFLKRPDTDTAPRDIDINHAVSMNVDNVLFRDCTMEGRNVDFTAIASVDNNAATITRLEFHGCRFTTNGVKAYGFYFANAATTCRRLVFNGCDFRGPSALMLVAGGSTSITYNATHAQRQSVSVTNCYFAFDKSAMPTSLDLGFISLTAWTQAEFRGNFIRAYNDFPVSVGLSYCYFTRGVNNLSLVWRDNAITWEGNNTFGVGRSAMYFSTVEADNAGLTQGVTIADNRINSTAGTGWTYGLLAQTGTTIPARRGLSLTGNSSNAANSADSNVVASGTTTAGAVSSGTVKLAVRTVTGATTANEQDGVILANSASGSITVTLPAAVLRHAFYVVKTSASNTVTVGSVSLTAANSVALVVSDGTTNTAVQIQ